MGKINVHDDFSTFCRNLRMSDSVVSNVRDRYHRITKRINTDYWSTDSDTSHSLYVGSYGRGTAIYASDIDIVVEIPWSKYLQYEKYEGNGQSAFLQDVKGSLKKTYSSTNISADGQVIVVDFYDGMKFEIVPSFKYEDGSYCYPDTNNGGSWKNMDPRAEIEAIKKEDASKNGNIRRLARMIRSWNEKMTVLMPGYLIDATVYRFLKDYEHSDKSYTYYDWFSRDYMKYLLDNAERDYWVFPGSGVHVKPKYSFKSEAKDAYNLIIEALDDYNDDYYYAWHEEWRKVYGNKFPST